MSQARDITFNISAACVSESEKGKWILQINFSEETKRIFYARRMKDEERNDRIAGQVWIKSGWRDTGFIFDYDWTISRGRYQFAAERYIYFSGINSWEIFVEHRRRHSWKRDARNVEISIYTGEGTRPGRNWISFARGSRRYAHNRYWYTNDRLQNDSKRTTAVPKVSDLCFVFQR